MTHESQYRSPLSESRRDEDSHTPVNPFNNRDSMSSDEHDSAFQLSPRFLEFLREKTTINEDVHEVSHSPNTHGSDHAFGTLDYRNKALNGTSVRVRAHAAFGSISPADGKTNDCDRRHTFDNFVNQQQIRGDLEPEKRVGHGWQVARALKRVMGSKKSRSKTKHVDAHV